MQGGMQQQRGMQQGGMQQSQFVTQYTQVVLAACTALLYGIKVSYWGFGTLKIVIPVEKHPQKPKNLG
eukprot:scaffold108679_cov39-Phaeocystis_antarctica.AAC.1